MIRQQAEIQKQHTAILGHVEQMVTHLEAISSKRHVIVKTIETAPN
jgi:hypothetical protein